MSSSGLFFETTGSFEVGQAVDLLVTLEHADSGRPVVVACKGRVCRVEEEGTPVSGDASRGVAVVVDAYGFDVQGPETA